MNEAINQDKEVKYICKNITCKTIYTLSEVKIVNSQKICKNKCPDPLELVKPTYDIDIVKLEFFNFKIDELIQEFRSIENIKIPTSFFYKQKQSKIFSLPEDVVVQGNADDFMHSAPSINIMFETTHKDYFIESQKINEDDFQTQVSNFQTKFDPDQSKFLIPFKIQSVERKFYNEKVKPKFKLPEL